MTQEELKRLQDEYLRKLAEAEDGRKPFEESGEIMPSDKQQQVKKLLDDADEIQVKIDAGRSDLDQRKRLQEHRQWAEEPATTMQFPGSAGAGAEAAPRGGAEAGAEVLQRAGFGEWLKHGGAALASGIPGRGVEEFKALQADSDTAGGYLIAPSMVVRDLIKNMDDMVYIRTLATVHQISAGQSLGAPTLETDISDPVWTSELQTGDEDETRGFGRRELNPSPLAKRVNMSNKLLQAPGIDAEAFWLGRMAYKFGVAEENTFLNGHGANQPLGLMVAHDDGIPTSRDVSDDNEATEVTSKGLINAMYTIKSAYWPRLRWMFHRDAVKQVRLLQDNDGQFLWQPNIQSGQPATILGLPFIMSEFMPNTFTTGKYVGIIGDFSKYWIVDSLTLRVQRLVELYAESNQVGFIGRLECDGAPTLAEAFARVKLA